MGEGYDLAVRVGQLNDSTLRSRKIGEVRRYLCASPLYLKSAGKLADPSDLADHNCLVFRTHPGSNVWQFSRRGNDKKNLNSRPVEVRVMGNFCANSGTSLVIAARSGMGLVLVPGWLVGATMRDGELVEVLPEFLPIPHVTPLYTVHPYQRFIPPKVKVFIEFLVQRFSKDYDWLS